MTVSTAIASKTYDGDNSTVSFPTEFAFFVASDIEVIERVAATGVETTKALTTDYVVTGGNGGTGTVVAVSPPPDTVTWTVRRVVSETQGTALPVGGALPSSAVEQALDRGVMMVQQHSEELGRTLGYPKTDNETISSEIPSSVERASKFLAFDANGEPIAAAGTTGDSTSPVSAFMNTVLDDADAATARATLGVAEPDAKGADVASATALTLGTDGNYFDVTGTTTITSIATWNVGDIARLHFDGAVTLTHHATNLILPGGANITTAAGDEFTFVEYAAGQWRCTAYALASGKSLVDLAQATQAAIEAETNEDSYVPPNLIRNNPGVAKFWAKFGATGNILASHNVTSVIDDGAALATVIFDTDFSSSDWVCSPSVMITAASSRQDTTVIAQSAGSVSLQSFTAAGAALDPVAWFVSGHGGQ